jgi:aldose 1-epimerase
MVLPEKWAATPDGQEVTRVSIGRDKLRANVITFGAILQDLRLPNSAHSLVLGYHQFAPYVCNPGMIGAIVGRYANRIANGSAIIGDIKHDFDKNQDGVHTLHGGKAHSGRRLWKIMDIGKDFVVLSDVIPADHMGFPGNLQVEARYQISDMALDIIITAKTDALTLCNFTNHSYFNLNANDKLQGHSLCLKADRYLDVDAAGIPTTGPCDVTGTEFDFRSRKPIWTNGIIQSIDHNFCLWNKRREITEVGTLFGETISMKIETTEPGLQVYTGLNLLTTEAKQEPLRPITAHGGIALEAQIWPDAPNHKDFPNALLDVGETYSHHTRYSFLI